MAKQKVYTEQDAEIDAFNEYDKMIRAKSKSLRTDVKKYIRERGLPPAEQQYLFLKTHPNTELPVMELDHKETVIAWRQGIEEYKYELKNPKPKKVKA